VNLSVIIACHNRRELTVRCIEKAQAAADYAGARISFTVFDDGSSDGTAEALTKMPASLRIMHGDGSAYWASGMAQAEASVLADADVADDGLLLWLNDDVALDIAAFAKLRATIAGAPGSVIVGAVRDPLSGNTTYSGMRRAGIHPLRFEIVAPKDNPQSIDAFNGNLVIVPVAVARHMGGIDGGFSHAFADIDYGLRCRRANVDVLLAPQTYGNCPRNEIPLRREVWADWLAFTGPKGGGNYSSVRRILGKGNPRSWPLFMAATYGLWWARRASGRLERSWRSQ
jgi:GT2 family glycosyltransferase